ncbi:7TM diverse intracellular signaling domain-containing protein [Hymenobacter nivis]|uniref:7TM diverse intracellular signaling domain-containing protein n=1 Tax=Hymenobacter nivis TaxID=1850093 RepID=UPI0013A54C6D|nr:7TM diverse intracellular signaling domain-containing protein [Hymenobacter nivis]
MITSLLPRLPSGPRLCVAWACWLLLGLARTSYGAPASDTLCTRAAVEDIVVTPSFYSVLEDPTGTLTLADVQRPANARRFVLGARTASSMQHVGAVYWVRLPVSNQDSTGRHWYLELFDSHINDITFYGPDGQWHTGADVPFNNRRFRYKNYLFRLPLMPSRTEVFYLRLQSNSKTSFLSQLRTEELLDGYFQTVYGLLGSFYGVLLIMVVYNLFIYLLTQDQNHLRYVLYVLSCGLLFLSEDGLGFQYIWPELPWLNQAVIAGAPILLLLTFSYYARYFLDAPQRLPRFDPAVRAVVLGSAVLLLVDAVWVRSGLGFWLYLLPYGLIYYEAVRAYQLGFRPARLFLLAQALVSASLLFLILRKLGIDALTTTFTVYSLNMAFVAEVVVLSYALGEKIKAIKDDTIEAQKQLVEQLRSKQVDQGLLVEQLHQNEILKDQLNFELEALVVQRTQEIKHKSETIAAQNRGLLEANGLLALQSAAIAKLNTDLQVDLHNAQAARVTAQEMNFGEFSQIYPDKDACLVYLANLKWAAGYQCRKCGHGKYCEGRELHSRRCTRCRYVESATAYTLLQKCKFSAVKALYAVFLLHTHKGQYATSQMSQLLDLRQATCWSFSQKTIDAIKRRSAEADYNEQEDWTHVLLATASEHDDSVALQPVATTATVKKKAPPDMERA